VYLCTGGVYLCTGGGGRGGGGRSGRVVVVGAGSGFGTGVPAAAAGEPPANAYVAAKPSSARVTSNVSRRRPPDLRNVLTADRKICSMLRSAHPP
jgi:hypothetical protein